MNREMEFLVKSDCCVLFVAAAAAVLIIVLNYDERTLTKSAAVTKLWRNRI